MNIEGRRRRPRLAEMGFSRPAVLARRLPPPSPALAGSPTYPPTARRKVWTLLAVVNGEIGGPCCGPILSRLEICHRLPGKLKNRVITVIWFSPNSQKRKLWLGRSICVGPNRKIAKPP
jgi:hypothetical protein